MPLYALVEFSNRIVANIENRSSAPPTPPGFRNIIDSDWAPGQIAAIGHIWNGEIPASFAPPVVEAVPGNLEAVDARLQALVDEIAVIRAGISTIQG